MPPGPCGWAGRDIVGEWYLGKSHAIHVADLIRDTARVVIDPDSDEAHRARYAVNTAANGVTYAAGFEDGWLARQVLAGDARAELAALRAALTEPTEGQP